MNNNLLSYFNIFLSLLSAFLYGGFTILVIYDIRKVYLFDWVSVGVLGLLFLYMGIKRLKK